MWVISLPLTDCPDCLIIKSKLRPQESALLISDPGDFDADDTKSLKLILCP